MSATSSAAEKSLAPPAMKATGAAARRWLRRDGFAILDQALFYGANFTMNILLARWLHATAYGAYAVALSVFFLTASLHTAVLTEPMMVYGARKYAHQFPQYVGPFVNITDVADEGRPLGVQLFERAVFDHGDAAFLVGDIDQHFSCHDKLCSP